jgi:hypothetical protein
MNGNTISIKPGDLKRSPFNPCGGLGKAYQLFGKLNEVLSV